MHYKVVGDPHLTLDTLDRFEKLLTWAVDTSLGNMLCGGLVLLGDIFETKSILRTEIQNFFYKKIKEVSEVLPVYIIVGNHDYTNLDCTQHAFSFWDAMGAPPNISIIDRPTFVNENTLMMPFYPDPKRFIEDLGARACNCPRKFLLFCHQGFQGFTLNRSGALIGEEGVSPRLLPSNVEAVISGHIHGAAMDKNIIYPGTPYAHSFNEANEQKSILMVTKDIKLEKLSFKRVPTGSLGLPEYRIILTTVKELSENIESFKYKQNDYVRFVIRDTQTNCASLTKEVLKKQVPPVDNLYLQFEYTDSMNAVNIDENRPISEMFREYVEYAHKDHPHKKEIVQTGIERYLNKYASL